MKHYYQIDGLTPITNLEDATFYISYGDFAEFVAGNCDINNYDKKWDFGEEIANNVCGYNNHWNLNTLESSTNKLSEREVWVLKFFKAHPFMKRIAIVFDD